MRATMSALVLLFGCLALAAGWAGPLAMTVLAAATLLPFLVLRAGAATRMPLPIFALAALLPVVLATGYVASTAGAEVLRDAVARLLTAARPAPPTPEMLLPGVLLAGFTGTWAGVRVARDPARNRFAPLACASVLYLAGALLTAGQADPYGLLAALMVMCAAASWSSRSFGRAFPPIAAAAVVAAVVVALVPAAGAFEPRHYVAPPPMALLERNPLPGLAALAEQENVELLRYSGPQVPMRLVTLTDFDGSSWFASPSYRPVGAVVDRSGLPPGPVQSTIDVEVTIGALSGIWLPTPGQPLRVTLPEAAADAETGSLALPQGLSSGLRYSVRGAVDTPGGEVRVATVPWGAEYTALPRLPYIFSEYAQTVVRGASTAFEQAVLIESAVRQDRRLNNRAPAGSSYARLETFLFGRSGLAGAQQGTVEQFAAAFAVLARYVGLPTRIVAGFRPGERAAHGVWAVYGRHATAWPEVYFAGHGWVAFDPMTSNSDNMSPAEALRRESLDRVEQNQRQTPSLPPPTFAAATPQSSSPPAAAAEPTRFGLPLGRAATTVVLGLFAAVVLSRAVRRWRHRRAGPRGAWSEVLDLLVLMNRRPQRWQSADQIAADIAIVIPATRPHPILRLAESADRAEFAPPATTPTAQVWGELRRLRRAARRAAPWYRPLLWWADPRPLLRR